MLRIESMWNELSDVVAAKVSGGANCPLGTEVDPDAPCCRILLDPRIPDDLMPEYCCIRVVVPDLGISRADADARASGRNATAITGTVTRPGFAGSSSSSRSG